MTICSLTLKTYTINSMGAFLYAVKMRCIDFLKLVYILQIETDSIKRNNLISIILFKVPPEHDENVSDNNVLMIGTMSRPIFRIAY